METKKLTGLFVLVVVLFLIPFFGFTQTVNVSNIHFRIIDDKIEVFYDLPINMDSVMVKLVFRKETDPKFKYAPKFVKGDVGEGIYSGPNRKIVWNYLKEPDYVFTGSGFYFDLSAKVVPKKPKAVPESVALKENIQADEKPAVLSQKQEPVAIEPDKIEKTDLPEVAIVPDENQTQEDNVVNPSVEMTNLGSDSLIIKPEEAKLEDNAANIVVPVPVIENTPEIVEPKEVIDPVVNNEVSIEPEQPKTEVVTNGESIGPAPGRPA
jgi:hypothetical protein